MAAQNITQLTATTGPALTDLLYIGANPDVTPADRKSTIANVLKLAYPVGAVFISTLTTNPNTLLGFGTWSFLGEGQVLVGLASGTPAFNTVKATGGALTVASTGTISTPTFTGDAYEPSGSNAISLSRDAVSGTNEISLFREAAAGSNAASVASGSISVEYPTGVPTFAGTAHQHGLPLHASATAHYHARNTVFGTGTAITFTEKVTVIGATGTNVVAVSSSLNVALSQTATAAGIISWPATAPSAIIKNATAAAQVFTGVTGSVSGQTFTGVTASVSGQVFTGVSKAPTGTVSKPTYVGEASSVVQPFVVVCMWERVS